MNIMTITPTKTSNYKLKAARYISNMNSYITYVPKKRAIWFENWCRLGSSGCGRPPPPSPPTEVIRSTISKHVHIIFLNLISMLHTSNKFSKCLLDGTKLLFIYI